jgi:hypothetical protein
MDNSTVYMGIGAQIIVNQYDTLTITEGSILLGCTTMWRGIHLDAYGVVKILSSTVKDAEIVIYASHRSSFILDAAQFYDFVTGIYGPPNPGGGFVTTSGKVVRSRFAGTFSFKPPYPGQTPPLVLPKAGIELNHVIMTIGSDTSSHPNVFDKLNNGIIGHNSRLTVRNSRFNYIFDQSNLGGYNGAAIVSIGRGSPSASLSYIKPQALAQDTMIYTSQIGIYAVASTTDITSVRMVNVGTGMYSYRGNNLLHTSINNCTIDAYKYGLFWLSNAGSAYSHAYNNKITVTGKATAMYLVEYSKTAPANYVIANNIINVNGADAGIVLHNVNRPVIKENNIRITPGISAGANATGIYLGGCSNPLVSCNDVAGNYYPGGGSNFTRGIFVGESDTTQITCNTTDSTYHGVHFHGWNPATALRGTNFYRHFEGLYLDKSAIIDQQIHHGNRWHVQAPPNGYGAVNMNPTLTGQDSSRFVVETSLVNTVYWPSTPGSNAGWFQDDFGSTFSCGIINPGSYCNSYDTEIVFNGSFDLKLAIAMDMLETVDWNEESQAKARQYLYDLLMQDTTLANSNSAFLDFIAEYEAVLHSAFEVYNDLRNVEQYDSLFTALIAEADSLIRFYSDSLTVIFDAGMEEELSQTVEDFYYQINFLEQTKGNLISQRQAFVEGELGELTHDYVISTELPNVNTQYINSVYSALLESGDNDEIIFEEHNSLLAVASQCPAAGGQSVYRARALLALINDSLEYDDYLTCLQSGIYRESLSENEILGVEIIPNPATNLITVRLLNKSRSSCNLRIINSFGAVILNIDLNCEIPEHVVNIEKLQAGVYFVHINFNESYNRTEKLIIIR